MAFKTLTGGPWPGLAVLFLILAVAMVLPGCGSLPGLGKVRDGYVESKSEIYREANGYRCNGGSIRDLRRHLKETGQSCEDFNRSCKGVADSPLQCQAAPADPAVLAVP